MGEQDLYIQIDRLRAFAHTHSDVVSSISGLADAGAHAAGVASSHGSIASAVHEALGATLDARQGAHRVVSATAGKLSESLTKAANHYEQVDQHAAAAARKAESVIDQFAGGAPPNTGTGAGAGPGTGSPSGAAAAARVEAGAAGTPASSAPSGAAAGGGAGQALGQLGQLGSQLGQSMSGMFEHKGQGGSFGQLMQGAEQLAQELGHGHANEAGDPSAADHAHSGDESGPDDRSRPRPV